MSAAVSDWRMSAACRDLDPDLFFPVGTEGPAATQAAEAKRVCAACPVRVPCLDWALLHSPDYGIWGATLPAERSAVRPYLTRGAA
jgi:WhiB family transcriptional regulator, redox-sensing transcriptional regulator